ncbi:MAG: PLxRFG domain-containing protein [Betaproteobacteria bacterium]|nr:PLxRFG domain-containing protein [Betaproteobacteria bacterium]
MALFMRAATSQFDTPEFKRWFGDSKVVDDKGKPLVVYHGTNADFSIFKPTKIGEFGPAMYFSSSANDAASYAGVKRRGQEEGAPNVIPVYLSIQNPYIKGVSAFWKEFGREGESDAQAIERVKAAGYDGIVETKSDWRGKQFKHYIVFDPTQIKSVYNVGTFDPSETEISYMRRAADDFINAGKDMSPEDREKLFRDVDDLDVTPKKGMEAIDSMIKNTPSFNSVKEKLGTYINDASTNNADNLLAFLNMRQLAELAKKILPQIGQYYRVITTMIDAREKQQTDAAKIYQRWEDWAAKHPALSQALDRVMMDARMSGIDPTIKADKIKKESFLANWNKIKGTEGEKIFIEVRDFWKKQLELKFAILEKKIEAMQTDQTERQKTIAELRSEYEKFISDGPYFPLTRFGDYFVAYNIKMPDGSKKPYHEMFESQADQRRHLESIEKDIASGKIIDIKSGVDTKEMISKGVVQSQFLNKIFKAVDGMDQGDLYKDTKQRVKDDIYQAYLSMMPDLSVHKHFIHAKKVAGASFDFRRGFAETAFHNINHLSRLQYGYTLDQIVAEAARVAKASNSNAAGRYLRELDKLHGQFSNPQKQNPIWSKISNFSFLFYLTAPASAIVNMTQTPIIGMPTMAGKFNVSYAKVGSEIVKASKEFFASRKGMEFNLSKYLRDQGKNAEADALDKLESTLNRTQTLSLAGVAERPSFMYTKGIREAMRSKGLSRLEKVNIGLGYMFNQAEIYNRYVTALVSIRLANEANSKLEVPRFNVEETARDLVNQIHFEYSSETKPRFMRGPLGQVALQFKNYSQQITYLLASSFNKAYFSNAEIEDLRLRSLDKGLSESERANAKREYEEAVDLRKEARTRFTGIMGMTALFAGYEGLPMYWALEGIMNMFFGDDDEPYDFSLEMKVALANLFGDNVSRMLSRGPMSEILQIDLAGRTSLNNIWFRDDATAKDEEEWVKNMLIDLMGPAAGIVVNTGDAIKKINEGHYWRGTEAMMPPILKDFFKAARFSTEGATTLRGDPIVPNIGPYGIFMQAMGFTPTDVARGYEAMGEIKGIEKKIEQRRSRLLGKLWLAHQSGDYEAYSDIGEDIIKFNAANPNEPIDDKTIKNSFAQRSRVMERAERGIVVSPKRQYLLEKTSYLEEE